MLSKYLYTQMLGVPAKHLLLWSRNF